MRTWLIEFRYGRGEREEAASSIAAGNEEGEKTSVCVNRYDWEYITREVPYYFEMIWSIGNHTQLRHRGIGS